MALTNNCAIRCAFLTLLVASSCAIVSCSPSSNEPPNVIIVVLDTFRADVVGAIGAEGSLTPNLDRLGREGAIFVNAFAPAPWTVPSHASLFTGQYPSQHGAVHGRFVLVPTAQTLAETLLEHGYQTAGFTCNAWLHARSGFHQGFELYEEVYKRPDQSDKGATVATRLVTDWLRSRRDDPRPFFLFVNYLEAHLPYDPPQSVRRLVGIDSSERMFTIDQAERIIVEQRNLSEAERDSIRSLYLAEVAYVDDHLGRITEVLKEEGELDRSLLIVTSDHGELLGEHRMSGHEFALYEELLRIPLLARYPKSIPPGTVVTAATCPIDVVPTVHHLLNLEIPPSIAGRSFLPIGNDTSERALLAEYHQPEKLLQEYWGNKYPQTDMSRFDVSLVAVREGSYKYLQDDRGNVQLYDVKTDPQEQNNLAVINPQQAAHMKDVLEASRPR